jgi:hypothetical protein
LAPPTTFVTVTIAFFPSSSCKKGARIRAPISSPPPAEAVIMYVIGFSGKFAYLPEALGAADSVAAIAAKTNTIDAPSFSFLAPFKTTDTVNKKT